MDNTIEFLKNLGQNLISEAIGIAVTVFIIDRLIFRRERKRWRRTEYYFWLSANNESQSIISALQRWLYKLKEHSCRLTPRTENNSPGSAVSPESSFSDSIENISYEFPTFSNSEQRIVEFSRKFLERYSDVIRDYDFRESSAWIELSTALEGPVGRLVELTAMTMVTANEPKFASSVMRIVQNMGHLRGAPYSLLNMGAAYDEWAEHLDKSMCDFLAEVLQLSNLVSGKLVATREAHTQS